MFHDYYDSVIKASFESLKANDVFQFLNEITLLEDALSVFFSSFFFSYLKDRIPLNEIAVFTYRFGNYMARSFISVIRKPSPLSYTALHW